MRLPLEKIIQYKSEDGIHVKAMDMGELVRCKDCKHSHSWYLDKRICELWVETGVDVFNDGFCSYGEREDDEHTD